MHHMPGQVVSEVLKWKAPKSKAPAYILIVMAAVLLSCMYVCVLVVIHTVTWSPCRHLRHRVGGCDADRPDPRDRVTHQLFG